MKVSLVIQKWGIALVCVMISLIIPPARAGPIEFSGSAQAQTQYDGITGKEQGRPEWVHTISISPTISLFGFPLDIPILLSTLESSWRQSFNRFTLHFRREWFNISVLDAHPTFSEYTLNGINIRGASIDLSPGLFRLAVAGGETQRAVLGSDTSAPSFRQTLYGLKIGGGKEGGIFYATLNLLSAKDQYDSAYAYKIELPQDTTDTLATPDTIEAITPEENIVAGVDLGTNLFDNRLSIKGEIAFSSFTRDSRSAEVEHEYIPKFLHPKVSSEFDLVYTLSSCLSILGASIEGSFKRVGTSFHSFGNPYLLNDVQNISLGYNQGFVDNQVSITFNYNFSKDNLSGLKTSTTTTTSYSPSLTLSFRNLPYFNISYSPYTQKNDEPTDTSKIDNRTDFFNISSGYGLKFLGMDHSLNTSASLQSYRDRNPLVEDTNNYDARTFMLSLSHSLKIPLSFNWGVSLTQNRYTAGLDSDIWSYNGGMSFSLLGGRLSPSLNISLNAEKNGETDNRKLSFGLNTAFRITTFADLSLLLERNDYKDNISSSENYQETLARLGISTRW